VYNITQEETLMNQKNIYGDGIKLDNGRFVRLSKLPLDEVITIRGKQIKVADIPLVAARLKCGCLIRGIAVQLKDIIFCDEHHLESVVVEVIK
jgi:hypothetical protein